MGSVTLLGSLRNRMAGVGDDIAERQTCAELRRDIMGTDQPPERAGPAQASRRPVASSSRPCSPGQASARQGGTPTSDRSSAPCSPTGAVAAAVRHWALSAVGGIAGFSLVRTALPNRSTNNNSGAPTTADRQWSSFLLRAPSASIGRPGSLDGVQVGWGSPSPWRGLVEVFARRGLSPATSSATPKQPGPPHAGHGRSPLGRDRATQDYPGLCAEHCVYGGGILRAVHRISSPEAPDLDRPHASDVRWPVPS